MPTYEYACDTCDEHFEVYQSFSDDPLTTHDGCGGKLSKVFGSVGIVLKGSGFYKTDKGSRSKAARKNGSDSSDGTDGSSDSSADTSSGTSADSAPDKASTSTSDTSSATTPGSDSTPSSSKAGAGT